MRFVPMRNNADTAIANVTVGKKALPTLLGYDSSVWGVFWLSPSPQFSY